MNMYNKISSGLPFSVHVGVVIINITNVRNNKSLTMTMDTFKSMNRTIKLAT